LSLTGLYIINSPDAVSDAFEYYIQNEYSYPSVALRIEYRNGLFRSKENCHKFFKVYQTIRPSLYR